MYVVWLPMLAADSRGEVDEDVLADPRVTQFWDEDRLVGRWLAETGLGEQISAGVVWDAYYLFGPEATWNERPGPLLGFGAPVIANTGSLENAVATVLGEQRNRAS